MSHLHIPDGILPSYLWILGFLLTGMLLTLSLYLLQRQKSLEKMPLVGVMVGIMLLAMSIPLGPLPYHLNLTVLTGIILGPSLAFIAIFVTNLFLAFMGHGGITVVGLNSLIIGLEALLGLGGFSLFRSFLQPGKASFLAVVCALVLSLAFMFSIIALSQLEYQEIHSLVFYQEACCQGDARENHQDPGSYPWWEELWKRIINSPEGPLNFFKTFSLLALPGIVLEGTITALVVSYLARVKPQLIEGERINK
ncbi:MAG: hypothetical protein D5R97_05080 [Candidatus Syntrophonatronum acetioxidans]|uniref:Energy-coupling factor ABC transporter permease n=1 Tax=Candidatus Syntrophonatronum acetioxidans TaxID=1795816 RepID=A0A424YEW4_9FIRM|nr:MAG: hypothetical protein D5R97_05080 [Candidatus Syntrophonatronum acetioxidans]